MKTYNSYAQQLYKLESSAYRYYLWQCMDDTDITSSDDLDYLYPITEETCSLYNEQAYNDYIQLCNQLIYDAWRHGVSYTTCLRVFHACDPEYIYGMYFGKDDIYIEDEDIEDDDIIYVNVKDEVIIEDDEEEECVLEFEEGVA